jgi:hypothetical protein
MYLELFLSVVAYIPPFLLVLFRMEVDFLFRMLVPFLFLGDWDLRRMTTCSRASEDIDIESCVV